MRAAKRKDSISVKLALILFGLVMGLLIAEVALRVHNPFGFRMRGNTIVLPMNQTYVIEDPTFTRFDKLDKRVVHTKNSLGFRGPEPPRDFAEHLTILTVGGSTTECFYLSDDQTWPAHLQRELQPSFPSLWINNAGLDGHSTFGHNVLVRDYVLKLKPNMVLFLVGINDLFADGPKSMDHMDRSSSIGALADHSELFALGLNMIRYRRTAGLKSLGAMPHGLDLNEPVYADVISAEMQALLKDQERFLPEYKARLASLIEMTRHSGIEPVLITQPALFGNAVDDVSNVDLSRVAIEIYRKMDGQTAWSLLEKYNDVTREIGREQNVKVIDLAAQLPKSSRYFYDYLHFGKEGAARVADIITDEVRPLLTEKWPGQAKTASD